MPAGYSPYKPSKYRRALEAACAAFKLSPDRIRGLPGDHQASQARWVYISMCASNTQEFSSATTFVNRKMPSLKWVLSRHNQLFETSQYYRARAILAKILFDDSE